MNHSKRFLLFIGVVGLVGIIGVSRSFSQVTFSTEKEIKKDISEVPCKNKNRLEGVRKLFEQKGAKPSDIKIDDFKHVRNLVVEKPGKSKETIIVGAHYDEAGGGCGAIDNWTGIVIIANLYKTIKNLDTNKTYKFVAFGQEELGLIGSKAMAGAIPKEERENYCAMVNLDSFGMTFPQAMRNISDKSLTKLAKKTAKAMKMPFSVAAIRGASSDSASFQAKKIPAIGIHGLSGRWKNYLHSPKDKVSAVNSTSVYYGYRFTLSLIMRIGAEKCDAFRK